MEVFIWIFFLMIQGSTAILCYEKECDFSPLEELYGSQIDYKPNEADLIRLCPPTLEFFNCYFKNIKDCFGTDVEEIAESPVGMDSAVAKLLVSGRNLSMEICNENSTLRKDYLENLECFRRLLHDDSDVASVCEQKSELDASAFLRQLHKTPKEDNVDYGELKCLQRVYNIACIAEQLELNCGETARRTLLAILERLQPLIKRECNIENSHNLRQLFLNYLELIGEKYDYYSFVFRTF